MTEPNRLHVSGATEEVCHRCHGTHGLVTGDGPAVCHNCIDMLGRVAADPYAVSEPILTALIERHGDVVGLARFPTGVQGETEVRWTWGRS